jgi:hypothetical protein
MLGYIQKFRAHKYLTYLQFNFCVASSGRQSNIRSKCMKVDLHVSASTSCMRSLGTHENILKPRSASLAENAFWEK